MTINPFISTTSGLQPNAGTLGTPGAIIATSTTSQPIAAGQLTFTIQPQCAFGPGMFVSMVNPSNNQQWMWGVVQSYDSISQLIVNVIATNGSGTLNSWQIALAGQPPVNGAQGPAGAAGAAGAAAGPLAGSTLGLKVTNNAGTPNTKIDITALTAVMVNSSGTSVRATSVSVTVDLTTGTVTAAANGMDGEARGTSRWVYVYLINNGSLTAGLATLTSPLSGGPTLPAGYTSFVYVGALYVDGSGNLKRTLQLGKRSQYSAMPTMGNGVAGSTTSPTWIAVTLATFVPATANKIVVVANADVGGTPTVVTVAPNNSYGNRTSTNPPPVSATGDSHSDELLIESANIYWASDGTDGYLFCLGWEDYAAAA